jgi:3-methyladenine DNA glycosylase AlkD
MRRWSGGGSKLVFLPTEMAMTKAQKKPVKEAVKKAAARPAAKSPRPAPARASRAGAVKSTPATRMTLAEVMRILQKLGSEQTRKTYARHGAKGPMFGVKFGDLFTLMKRIDVDHALARELWATGNVDARNLAMKIADAQEIIPADLDRWALENELRMCNLYVATLAAESPHGRSTLRRWIGASDERLLAAGWTLLGRLSDLDESFPEEELLRRVAEIEKSIHAAPNEVRSDMNRALITIGGRAPALRKAVIAAAKRIGAVSVDHGGTACKTPDAVEAVEKMWARSGTRFPSPAAHERSMRSMRRRC